MKSTKRGHHKNLLFWLCIIVNISISLLIGILFVIKFIPNANTDDGCASIGCLVSANTYLTSYHISNAISVINLFASMYFLLLYRKYAHTVNKAGKLSSKILNVIKFTICLDIFFDIVPTMVSVGLAFHGSVIGSYFKYFAWILFAFCGVCVNRHIYKALLINDRVSIVKTTSNMIVMSHSVNVS
uniref:G_PROTEIN_RECEP_F1_2 domain-containing protein n=1 Tax=Panagrellus redivivus TaxID=6233 RepID=A0A7E4V6P0_PANRE